MALTSYNAQRNLIRALLAYLLPHVFVLEAVQNLVFEMTSTVTISQMTEN